MFSSDLVQNAQRLLQNCRDRSIMLATAESCTGGLIAALLTEIPGSSDVVERCFVTYSNSAKSEMLGVSETLINRLGAVSHEVAKAMADGALAHSRAQIAVSVTGVAGPGGGTIEKPIGLVYLALAQRGRATVVRRNDFPALGRSEVRLAAVNEAVHMLSEASAQ